MKSIASERFAFRVLTSSLLFVFIAFSSSVSLAVSSKPVGEILVSGSSPIEGETVTVNGEPARTGRTIFASSSIVTPEGMAVTLNLGKAGKIQLDPGTEFLLNVDGDSVNGDLKKGSLSVLNSASPVGVRTLTGDTVNVNGGETVAATAASSARKKAGPGGVDWWIWGAIIAGATVAVILIATRDDDDGTVTSPVR